MLSDLMLSRGAGDEGGDYVVGVPVEVASGWVVAPRENGQHP